MIDYFNMMIGPDKNTYVFYSTGTLVWQTWQKPRGCKFIQFLVIGGGGGGGAGGTSASGNRSGGAGGGGSGISRLFVPTSYIPDTLYVSVGRGGSGGLPTAGNGGSGSCGELSYVSVLPNTNATNVLLSSGTVAAGFGNGGVVGSTPSTPGAGGTIFAATNGLFAFAVTTTYAAGTSGGNGGNASSTGIPATITMITCGGSGGAGTNAVSSVGAGIVGSGFVPTISGGSPTTLSQASSGFSSFNENLNTMRNPLFFTGGGGGYSRFNAAGGDGGSGAYGSGGGGGGAGTTGGSGGKGGNGLVIITCW
jgi:hypothetical protein